MDKRVEPWTVADLQQTYPQVDFPEYQREPNLWSLTEKQRLIDSILRRFDIASIYLYVHEDASIDCVDGRQRIGAIMSFLGHNPEDKDSGFRFRHLNEVYQDASKFDSLENKTFAEIKALAEESGDSTARSFVDRVLNYPLTVVVLSDSRTSGEFNLQFTRLNLGTIINSGEKLHAMVGELRNECFNQLGNHLFLEGTSIPTRRFAREQVAAQILSQVFSKSENNEYTRTRHFDLQRLFKENAVLSDTKKILVKEVADLFDKLHPAFEERSVLRNRAITVSAVLLARAYEVETDEQATELADFIEEFILRLKWQSKKGLLADPEYHYILNFQRNITQASAERSSVAARAELLENEFQRWQDSGNLRGDADWKQRHPGLDPKTESRRQ